MPRIVLFRSAQALVLALLPALAFAQAQTQKKPPTANYRLASKYSLANINPRSYSTFVQPNWIGKTDEFWYGYRTSKGTLYWRVDPAKKTRVPLFDHEKLAARLAEVSRKPVDVATMRLTRSRLSDDSARFSFVFAEVLYDYDLKNDKLTSRGKAPPMQQGPGRGFGRRGAEEEEDMAQEQGQDKEKDTDKEKEDKTKGGTTKNERTFRVMAPDKKGILLTRENDLFLAEAGKEKEALRLTKGGTAEYNFSLFGGGGNRGMRVGPRGVSLPRSSTWSPDSKYFQATRQDNRGVKELYLVNSLGSPRPTLEKYSYSMPGEDAIRKGELHIGSLSGKAVAQVKPKWRDESYSWLHWGKNSGELRFIRLDRLRRNLEVCAVDVATGNCRALISEGFDNAHVEYDPPVYLDSSDEMIWWSERSGWGHFYLYDRNGKLKNAITSGSWRASRIVAYDEKNRVLYFQGNAREKGENVYYEHLYSVKLDGTGLTLLDPGDAHHNVFPTQGSYLSPGVKYVVDNSTRVDKCPDTVLRDAKGKKIMDLEKADLSRLQEYGWKPPETFVIKAADGVTDLYGNMWKPFDFDAKKKYPIIAHVYPGPQTEGVTHAFSAYSSNMQLAQLGFIVIQVGHRGGSPLRSKAYGSYGYFNLRDYGLEDKKHAIEQLAAKYSWIDLKQVGIYGHSGGGFMTGAAMMQKPYNEFFKAGVASAGNHDNNIYHYSWSERYHGLKEIAIKEEAKDKTKRPEDSLTPAAPPPRTDKAVTKTTPKKETPAAPPPKTKFEIKVPTNTELAANLKGRLMLVHGEIDNNVHPANTMRLVDALIKANKRFDMLITPGKRHGFGDATAYFQRRMQEFFAEHLLGDRRSGADMDDRNGE